MAKIAVDLPGSKAMPAHENGGSHTLRSRLLAEGQDWLVEEVICSAGPNDRPFEEQHSLVVIAIVLSGTFQYRTASRTRGAGQLMSPGSVMLGNAGQSFECGHEHAVGDRCLSFRYAPEYFERIAADSGADRAERRFLVSRVPPVRDLSPAIAKACAAVDGERGANACAAVLQWEELSIQLAAQSIVLANDLSTDAASISPSTVARITRALRFIESNIAAPLSLNDLAGQSRLSPYHFLRSFEQVTGITPLQYVRRARLRAAAARLKSDNARVLDVALDCGFADVSNFNRAFHREFDVNPLHFRAGHAPFV